MRDEPVIEELMKRLNLRVYRGIGFGEIVAVRHVKGTKWGAINNRGKQILPPKFDWIEISCDYIRADVDGKHFFLYYDGKLITDRGFLFELMISDPSFIW